MIAINADDTDFVKAGQPLVKLDPADAQVALDQAEAQLAQTVRQVRTLYVNNGSLAAQIALREADVARAQSDIAARPGRRRRAAQPLVAHRRGRQGRVQPRRRRSSPMPRARWPRRSRRRWRRASSSPRNQALTEGTAVEQHPNVQRAAAAVREAYLALQRAELPAPVDGYVARRTRAGRPARRRPARR